MNVAERRYEDSTAREFVDGDFRRSSDADGHSDGADAAIYIQLASGLAEPSGDVGRHQPAGGEFRTDKLQRRLASMSMAGHAQVDAHFGGAVERIGVVAEQDVDAVRREQ